mmetsp:Transcript_24746/g.42650  ORF Transcript_24746/g.42650 Transcript_24746/m.42650 type:complete len:217 (-) Transcript_24746:20-670(-)
MAKSLASTACLPSLPLTPTPMCAARIMPTSLAPSPMASVVTSSASFTMLTTWAFCSGATRQHMTEKHMRHAAINWVLCFLSSAMASVCPSMISAIRRPSPDASDAISFSAVERADSNASCDCSEMMNRRMDGSNKPHEKPMFTEVSCRSPVRTHTLIPALCKDVRVSATPSCNRSSMAVAPRSFKSRSISSAAASTLESRSTSATDASWCTSCHCL